MGIDLTKPTPLYNQIADDIYDRISKNKIREGELIGSHQKLANDYGVSLITIRKALDYILPFSLEIEKWQYKQIKKISKNRHLPSTAFSKNEI